LFKEVVGTSLNSGTKKSQAMEYSRGLHYLNRFFNRSVTTLQHNLLGIVSSIVKILSGNFLWIEVARLQLPADSTPPLQKHSIKRQLCHRLYRIVARSERKYATAAEILGPQYQPYAQLDDE
jgi:hypothetical protein